jgi:hypothetical protein
VITWDLHNLVVLLLTRSPKGWLGESRFLKRPLCESPFFLTLAHNDRRVFQDYYNIITDDRRNGGAYNPKEINYEGFMDLYEDIKENGIKDTSTIKIHKNYEHIIADGQHRLAILLYLGKKEITLPDTSIAQTDTSGRK